MPQLTPIKLLLCFILFVVASSHSQEFRSKKFGMEDGLSFRDVTCIIQDHQGMMWIGTKRGLNRFDGYQFSSLSDLMGDEISTLNNSPINDIQIDSSGNLWIATNEGLDVLDPNSFAIRSFNTTDIFGKASGIKKVDKLKILSNGRIFIKSFHTACGRYYYSCREFVKGKFKEVKISDGKSDKTHEYLIDFFEDASANTWVRPNNCLSFFMIDQDYNILKKASLPDSIDNYNLDNFIIHPNSKEIPLFGCNTQIWQRIKTKIEANETIVGISLADSSTFIFVEFNLNDNTFEKVDFNWNNKEIVPSNPYYDLEGNLWFTEGNHLFKREADKLLFTQLDGLAKNSRVSHLYQSNDHTLWVGNSFGLHLVKSSQSFFRPFFKTQLNESGFGNSCRSITVDSSGNLYVAAVDKGILKVNKPSNKIEQVVKPTEIGMHKTHSVLAYGLHYRDSTLWISNRYDPGVLKFDIKSKKFDHLVNNCNTVGFGKCFLYDSKGRLWQGTDQGINLIDIQNNETINCFIPKNDFNVKTLDINNLFESNNGNIFVSTQNSGLFVIDSSKNIQLWLDKRSGLSSNTVQSVNESDHYYWVGTANGLNRIHKKSQNISVFTSKHGLPNNNIYALGSWKNQLWCSTDNGLSRLNITDLSFKNYTIDNDLPHNEFNRHSFCIENDSLAYFGGLNGVVQVEMTNSSESNYPTHLFLTALEKFDGKKESIISIHPPLDQTVEITPWDNFFTFHFATTDFFNANQIIYTYKMDGLDEQWNPLGNAHEVRYNKLPAGDYTFKVKALSAAGVWLDSPLSIPISVSQAFYKTDWFYAVCIITLLFIIYAIYQYRLNQFRKVESLRLKIASDLHDDVGSLLTQISLQSDLVEQGIYHGEEKKHELSNIATTSRKAIKTMSDVVWSIDSRRDRVGDLIDRMKDFMLEVCPPSNLKYELNISNLSSSKKLPIQLKQNVYLIFKEAVNNVIKHSNASSIEVDVFTKNGKFHLHIKDNGTLSKNEGRLVGQGLQNMKLRANKMKGHITIDKRSGFHIYLSVPFLSHAYVIDK